MTDQRNMILAFALSIGVLLLFDVFYYGPQREAARERARLDEQSALDGAASGTAPEITVREAPTLNEPGVGVPTGSVDLAVDRAAALNGNARVSFDAPRLDGSISLVGGRLDDVRLKDYHTSIEDGAPEVTLFNPKTVADAYYLQVGWAATGGIAVPDAETRWAADRDRLTFDTPVTLRWDNGAGLVFERVISIDENFLFTVEQRVINNGETAVTLAPYALVNRKNPPANPNSFIQHLGPIGAFRGEGGEARLKELTWSDLRDDGAVTLPTRGGWIGMTDDYWLTALIPDQAEALDARFTAVGPDRFQVDMIAASRSVSPGERSTTRFRLFAGAKEIETLQAYGTALELPLFDRVIDWGNVLFIFTKSFSWLLRGINDAVGNYGVAILIFTFLVKTLLFPLSYASYVSMSKMKKLQPKMKELQERHKDDKQRLQQELMEFYKKEKINPASGCVPILLQIPVFFALYKVLYISIEMRHQPFFGWIRDLAAPDPLTPVNLFGLLPFDPPGFIAIGIWPIIMGLTMWLQFRIQPSPSVDPMQKKIMSFMPVIFTVILAPFPAGLVIYWTWNNILTIIQQWVIMKRVGVDDPMKA